MTPPISRRALLAGLAGGAVLAGCDDSQHAASGFRPGASRSSRPEETSETTSVAGTLLPAASWVRVENARPGSRGWVVTPNQVPHAIEGYADVTSAVAGEQVKVFVNTVAKRFHVEAYRVGYYSGIGARLVWRSPELPGENQTAVSRDRGTNMVECHWRPSLEVPVDKTWPPGVYLLKLVGDGGQQQYVPLTVRDDSSHAAFCVMNSVTTWQAYNLWGEYSLYLGPDGAGQSFDTRARVVSLDKPLPAYWGRGAADLIGLEIPLVNLLERYGLDVTYWTDLDLHARPQLLHDRGALLSLGHDEYWSADMYDAALAARNRGVNLAFLGANACYRHIRMQPSDLGRNRRVVCYKVAEEDPLYGKANSRVTSNWPDPPVPRNESQLVGASYRSYPVRASLSVSRSWLFKGVPPGAHAPNVIGDEYDAYVPTDPHDGRVDVLAHSPLHCRGVRDHSDTTWYTVPGGGGVFASGTISWIAALSDARHAPMLDIIPGRGPAFEVVSRATLNVLNAIGFGPAHNRRPSTGTARRYYRPGYVPPNVGLEEA